MLAAARRGRVTERAATASKLAGTSSPGRADALAPPGIASRLLARLGPLLRGALPALLLGARGTQISNAGGLDASLQLAAVGAGLSACMCMLCRRRRCRPAGRVVAPLPPHRPPSVCNFHCSTSLYHHHLAMDCSASGGASAPVRPPCRPMFTKVNVHIACASHRRSNESRGKGCIGVEAQQRGNEAHQSGQSKRDGPAPVGSCFQGRRTDACVLAVLHLLLSCRRRGGCLALPPLCCICSCGP